MCRRERIRFAIKYMRRFFMRRSFQLRANSCITVCGFDHMEDDDQDRGDEENGQKVGTLEREEEVNGWRDNAQSDT